MVVSLLRVVQVIDTLDAGGYERVAVDIANFLPQFGVSSFVCTTRRSGMLKDHLRSDVTFFSLKRKSRFDLAGISRFRAWIKANRIGIVHAHGNSSAKFCALALLGTSSVIIHHDHNPLLDHRNYWIERFVLGWRVAAWICVSKEIHCWVTSRVNYQNAVFIGNPVIESRFQGERVYTLGKIRLVHLANFKPHKDHKNLIEAVRGVLKYRSDFVVECYGGNYDSPYRQEIDGLIAVHGLDEFIKLNGSESDVPSILLSSQIGLLSSRDEGLPISLLEYLASGLPVVATNVGECGDVVRKSQAGIVVEPNRPVELAMAIRQMLDSSAQWRTFGACGMAYIHEHHSIGNYMKRIIDLYGEVS